MTTYKATTPPLTGAELDKPLIAALESARELLANVDGLSKNNICNLAAEEVDQIDAAIAQARAQQESAAAPDLTDLQTYPSPHGTLVRLADVKCRIASQPPAPVVAADERALRLVNELSRISMRLAADLVQGADYTFQGHDYLDRNFVCERVMQWRTEWDATDAERAALSDAARAAASAPPAPLCHAPAGLLAEILALAESGMCQGLVADDYCSQIVAKIKAAPDAAHAQQDTAPVDYTVDDSELARKIFAFMGRATTNSMEPGADPLRDRLAERLATWRPAVAPSDAKGKADAANAGGMPFDLSKITRWTFDGGMTAQVAADGQWVHYKDLAWRCHSPTTDEGKTSAADAKDAEIGFYKRLSQQAQKEAMRESVRDAVAEALDGLYTCGRVWSAWSYGTMSQDDFAPAGEDDDVVDNITDAAIAAMAAATSSAAGKEGGDRG